MGGVWGSGGGGGDGSSNSSPAPVPTDTNLAFQLFPAGFFSDGYTEKYLLIGRDTAGGTYAATLSATTQAQTTFNDQPAIPVQSLFELTQIGAFEMSARIDYYSTDSESRMYLGFTGFMGTITDNNNPSSTTYTYTAVSLNVIPQSAKIGEGGSVGTYSGGGMTDQISWQLTNAGNGLANLVINHTFTISGNFQWSEKRSYVIDQFGDRRSVTVEVAENDLNILTLSGFNARR